MSEFVNTIDFFNRHSVCGCICVMYILRVQPQENHAIAQMTARCAQYMRWRHRTVKIKRQIIADIIGITDILSQRYRYMAHHYSLAIRQAFWKLPDVTHFGVLSTGLCTPARVPNEL